MFRYNLITASLLLLVWCRLSPATERENLGLATIAGPAMSELEIPEGFSLEGKKLTMPNGQTLENVSGLQKCGTKVLIVSQREIGVYSTGRKPYSALRLPAPLGADGEFTFITFNALGSINPKAGEQTAYIAIKEPAIIGVYRYQAAKPKFLQYIPVPSVKGGRFVPYGGRFVNNETEFWSWCTCKGFVDFPERTVVVIDTTNGVSYCRIATLNGQEYLKSRAVPPTSINGQRLAAVKAKFEEQQAKLAAQESSATEPVSASGGP